MSDSRLTVQYGAAPLIKASFCISGRDFDTRLVTDGLGTQPTEVWSQKRPELRKLAELDNEGWYLEIRDEESRSVSVAVERLLDLVLPIAHRLPAVLHQVHARAAVVVTVTITEDRPVYDLSSSAIMRLAQLNCSFIMDIFDNS
jgi:hypothetical protein